MGALSKPTRLPKNHQLVYDVVRAQGRGSHASTSEVLSRAKQLQPRIGYSTVYRALDRLRELGLIAQLCVPGTNTAVYEVAAESHAHFLCTRCGRVDDVGYTLSPKVLTGIAQERGIAITDVLLTLHGVCAACRKL